MASPLESAIRQVRGFLAECDPERYSTEDAVRIIRWGCELERQAQALKLLFSERAAQSMAWAQAGCSSPEQWFAQLSKAPLGEAISTMETSKALKDLPETKDALREGKLSRAQAQEITKTAKKDPTSQAELLELAATESLKRLKDRSRQLRFQAASRQDEAKRNEEIHRRRYVRYWTDPDGAFCLHGRFAPLEGGRLRSALDEQTDAVFDAARIEGRRESHDAYRADALVMRLTAGCDAASTGSQRRSRRRDHVLVIADVDSLVRGWVGPGERCELPGVGSVTAAQVRRMMGGDDADSTIVFKNTKDVAAVCRIGRIVAPEQRISLTVRDGGRCQVPGCEATQNLEAHHWKEPFAVCGTTSLDNLVLICPHHHDLVTYHGWTLEGGPGHWRFRGPPEDPPARIFATG